MSNIQGNLKVNPDKATVNGRPIRGWWVGRVTGSHTLREWLELFVPSRLKDGQQARPLVFGDDIPPNVNAPAPAERPPVPPSSPGPVTVLPPGLQTLKRDCNIAKNSGATTISIDYVLKCLEKPTT